MESKYANLVKRLQFKENMGGTPARFKVYMEATDLADIEVNFVVGVYEVMGLWAPKRGYKDTVDRALEPKPSAHAHAFEELLFFFGYGEDGLSNLGAQVNLSIGKEWEQHIIGEPSIVALPKMLPHCPVYTEKLERPFAHMHIALSVDHGLKGATTIVEQDGNRDAKKYSSLVNKFPLQENLAGASQGYFISGEDLQNIPVNITMGLYKETGAWYPQKGAIVHPYDKLMIFFGNNADNPNELGAEVSVEIGHEHEKYTFSEATVIVIPKGTPHMPVVCSKLDRSYYGVQVGFSAHYECEQVG